MKTSMLILPLFSLLLLFACTSREELMPAPSWDIPGTMQPGELPGLSVENAEVISFTIYNRWGSPVYETVGDGHQQQALDEALQPGYHVATLKLLDPGSGDLLEDQKNIILE